MNAQMHWQWSSTSDRNRMAGFRLPGALPNLPGGRKPRPAAGRATPGGLRLPRMGVGTWAWGNQLVRPPSGPVPGPSHSPAACSFPHGRPAPGASARRSRRWASERPAADHGRPRALQVWGYEEQMDAELQRVFDLCARKGASFYDTGGR